MSPNSLVSAISNGFDGLPFTREVAVWSYPFQGIGDQFEDVFDHAEWYWGQTTVSLLFWEKLTALFRAAMPNRDELMADWELAVSGENPYKIAPP